MNEPIENQPSLPRNVPSSPAAPPPAGDSTEREPIANAAALIEAMLRQPRRIIHQVSNGSAAAMMLRLLVLAVLFVTIYGAIVGSFSGGEQWWAAPAKIAVGMTIAAAICLPSLYIFSGLCGSPARFMETAGALSGLLALTSLLLIGFAPVAWLFSQSTESVAVMGSLHLLFWSVAVIFGVRFLMNAFRQFGLRSQAGLRVWVVIFLLVSLQMTTALRPLVGRSDTLLPMEKRFFLAHWARCLETPPPRH